jgi:hypothetical protein
VTARYGAQSELQFVTVSPLRQKPSPQVPHGAQSTPHATHVSAGCSQEASGEHTQPPQSAAQVTQFSPSAASQTPSPQLSHWPQSAGQRAHVSPELHMPFPQRPRLQQPQSFAQLSQSSPSRSSQRALPHTALQPPQS